MFKGGGPGPKARSERRWPAYGLAVVLIALATLLRWLLPHLLAQTPYLSFYPAVVAAAAFGGRGPGLLATIGSYLCVDLLFDGTPGWVNLLDPIVLGRMAIFLSGGVGISIVAGLMRDARTRQGKQAEDSAELVRLLDLANVLVRDLEDRITRWNTGCRRLYGFTAEQAVGRVCHELLRTRYSQPKEAIRDTVLSTGRWEGELTHTAADGREVVVVSEWVLWREPGGKPVAILEMSTDITDRQRTDNALRESEQRIRASFENAALGMLETDDQDRVTAANQRICQLLGYRRDELLGSSVDRFTPAEDRADVRDLTAQLRDARIDRIDHERRCVRADGSILWVHLTASAIRDQAGGFLRAIRTLEDISQRKAAESALADALCSAERAKAVAEEANRAKDHFLAVLSHELRTPLTPVVAAIAMLQQQPDLDAVTRKTLEMIRRNAEFESRLIDDLLDVTRIARGKVELVRSPLDLRQVLKRTIDVCRAEIEACGLEFNADFGEEASWIEGDASRLQQIFWNLLKNAIKFTPHGGRVDLRCRRQEGYALVEVTDNGIGIEAEALTRLFHAFEQVERSITRRFGGLGLGLAISKALVEMHRGTIDVQSAGPGQGTTFRVRLPQIPSPRLPPSADIPGDRHPVAEASSPLRILLIEDHADTAEIMSAILTLEGHDVKRAGDIATGLRLAGEHAFDLLISDIGLPDGNGYELLRQLRSRGINLPGIALSGYGHEEDVQRSLNAGFLEHLTKPIAPDRLTAAMRHVTARR